jgi:hypothetical protein
MSFIYRGFELNSLGESPWYDREINLFRGMIDTILDVTSGGGVVTANFVPVSNGTSYADSGITNDSTGLALTASVLNTSATNSNTVITSTSDMTAGTIKFRTGGSDSSIMLDSNHINLSSNDGIIGVVKTIDMESRKLSISSVGSSNSVEISASGGNSGITIKDASSSIGIVDGQISLSSGPGSGTFYLMEDFDFGTSRSNLIRVLGDNIDMTASAHIDMTSNSINIISFNGLRTNKLSFSSDDVLLNVIGSGTSSSVHLAANSGGGLVAISAGGAVSLTATGSANVNSANVNINGSTIISQALDTTQVMQNNYYNLRIDSDSVDSVQIINASNRVLSLSAVGSSNSVQIIASNANSFITLSSGDSSVAVLNGTGTQIIGKFACNSATPQARFTVGGDASSAPGTQTLANNLKAALIAFGIATT